MPGADAAVRTLGALVLTVLVAVLPAAASAETPRVGIVLMHGKGGTPTRHVGYLASALAEKGYLVANLEMPWSQKRSYDADVAAAVSQVEAELDRLRTQGATRLFVAGHSQGGLFALYFGGRHAVDGVIAIAPGGNVGSPTYREKLGASVAQARKLIAEGKGNDRASFLDFEGSRGTYAVVCTAADYLSWFDPEGAMNEALALRHINPEVPVLFIVPKGDYPALQNAKPQFFAALPRNPLTKLYEPDSSHLDAATASVDEIERWTAAVASRDSPRQAMPASAH